MKFRNFFTFIFIQFLISNVHLYALSADLKEKDPRVVEAESKVNAAKEKLKKGEITNPEFQIVILQTRVELLKADSEELNKLLKANKKDDIVNYLTTRKANVQAKLRDFTSGTKATSIGADKGPDRVAIMQKIISRVDNVLKSNDIEKMRALLQKKLKNQQERLLLLPAKIQILQSQVAEARADKAGSGKTPQPQAKEDVARASSGKTPQPQTKEDVEDIRDLEF
jgi:hypothetical protein